MSAVFISHNDADRRIVDPLVRKLKDKYKFHNVYVDHDREAGNPPGVDWEKKLYAHLSMCRVALFIVSRNWLASKWCWAEFTQAQALGKPIWVIVVKDLGSDLLENRDVQWVMARIQLADAKFDLEKGLDDLCAKIMEIGLAERHRLPPGRPVYPGFNALDVEDAAIFFGRDAETDALIQRLESRRRQGQHACLLITSPSGYGKSSLLRAGLAANLPLEGRKWRPPVIFRPLGDPLKNLAEAITPNRRRSFQDPIKLAGALRASASGLGVCLCVDQAEELFTASGEEARKGFAKFLGHYFDALQPPVSAVFTLVDRHLDRMNEFLADAAPHAERFVEPLRPLGQAGLFEMISLPAERRGFRIEPALAHWLSDNADRGRALPLVAVALDSLTKTAKPGDTIGLGQLGADPLQGFASKVIGRVLDDAALTAAEAATLEEALVPHFVDLVRVSGEPGERQAVRRRAKIKDVPEGSRSAILKLVAARLIREEGEWLELAHEQVLIHWPQLAVWIGVARKELVRLDELRNEAAQWAEAERSPDWLKLSGDLLRETEALARDPRFTPRLEAVEREYLAACRAKVDADIEALETRERKISAQTQRLLATAVRAASSEQLYERAARIALVGWPTEPNAAALVVLEPDLEAELARAAHCSRHLLSFAEHERALTVASFDPDGTHVLTACEEKFARIWEADSGQETFRMEHEGSVYRAAFSPDATHVVTISSDRAARIWHLASRQLTARILHISGFKTAALSPYASAHYPIDGGVLEAAFSPNGTRLLTVTDEHSAWVSDLASGKDTTQLRHEGEVVCAAFSSDGTLVVTASWDKSARVWDAESGREITRMDHEAIVRCAAFSPEGTRVVTACDDRLARVWEAASGRVIASMKHAGEVRSAAFSPDGTRVLTVSADQSARIWDAATAQEIAHMQHQGWVNCADFSPDGTRVVTASSDASATVWDVANGREIARMQHEAAVKSAGFSPDSMRIVTACQDQFARVWDAGRRSEVVWTQTVFRVTGAAFSSDGTRVVTASWDKSAQVWDAESGREITRMDHEAIVRCAAFSPDGTRVVTACDDRLARVWEAASGRVITSMKHAGEVRSAAFSPDGTRVLTVSAEQSARIWDAATAHEITHMQHQGWVNCAAFSPDGTRVVTASWDSSGRHLVALVRVWDTASGRRIAEMWHRGIVVFAAFSPDGTRLVTACEDKFARVWDAKSGREIAQMQHAGEIESAAFSRDGTRVVTASKDKTARVWDSASGLEIVRMHHEELVTGASFSPDGTRLVTACEDKFARVWDVESGLEIARMQHAGGVDSAAFSPDGTRVVTASQDKSVCVWNVRWATMPAAELPEAVVRGKLRGALMLTDEERRILRPILGDVPADLLVKRWGHLFSQDEQWTSK
jgi:WD40 repeat protein